MYSEHFECDPAAQTHASVQYLSGYLSLLCPMATRQHLLWLLFMTLTKQSYALRANGTALHWLFRRHLT
jgi:hypothetical protein